MKEKTIKGDDDIERTGQDWVDFIYQRMMLLRAEDDVTDLRKKYHLYASLNDPRDNEKLGEIVKQYVIEVKKAGLYLDGEMIKLGKPPKNVGVTKHRFIPMGVFLVRHLTEYKKFPDTRDEFRDYMDTAEPTEKGWYKENKAISEALDYFRLKCICGTYDIGQ